MDRKKQKFLLIRPDAIGDCILITPAISLLRKKYPESHIAVLANSYTKPIFENNPDINEVINDPLYKKKFIVSRDFLKYAKELKSKNFDFSIHFFNELPYALLAKLAGIKIRIGDKSKPFISWLYNRRVSQNWNDLTCHEVENNIKLLLPLRIDISNPPSLMLQIPESEKLYLENFKREYDFKSKDLIVSIHLGAGTSKPYLPERYAKIIDYFSPNCKVILTGSEREKKLADEVMNLTKNKPINLVQKTNLEQLINVISACSIFISVDTGPLHIAAALKRKCAAIFTNKYFMPSRWAPWQTPHQIVRKFTKCLKRCFPPACSYNDCLREIEAEDIIEGVKNILAEKSHSKEDWFRLSCNILTNDENIHRELKVNGYNSFKLEGFSLFDLTKMLIERNINVIHWTGEGGTLKIKLARFIAVFFLPLPPLLIFDKKTKERDCMKLVEEYRNRFRSRKYL